MSGSDSDGILARLWCYVSLLPADISVAYSLKTHLPRGMDGIWVQFLNDLADNRLADEQVQERYARFFPDPGRAQAAMRALQNAWREPRMSLLREMMEKDIRALRLQAQGTSLVPVEVGAGHGNEGSPA